MGPVRRGDEESGSSAEDLTHIRRHEAKGRKRLRMETGSEDDVQILEEHDGDLGRQQAARKGQKPEQGASTSSPGPSREGKKRGKTEDSEKGKERAQTKGKGKGPALLLLHYILLFSFS